jgi:hypothetical protein
MPEGLKEEAREQLEQSNLKSKTEFDKHHHDNIKYTVEEIVVLKQCPTSTEESTEL